MKKYYIKDNKGSASTLTELLMKYMGKSRDEALKLIEQGSVWNADENSRIKDPLMQPGKSVIKVNLPVKPVIPHVLKPEHLIYEDKYLMVIYKDAGISSHPTPYSDVDSLVHGVAAYLKNRGSNYEPSVINRLDKPTRGLLLFAKNKESERRLHAMFREKRVRKAYLVLTEKNNPERKNIIIRNRLDWNGKIRDAVTYVRYLGDRDGKSCFLAFPRTGRTHQIRKHFAEFVSPVYGDRKYGGYRGGDLELICFSYSFLHPFTGERMVIRHIPQEYGGIIPGGI